MEKCILELPTGGLRRFISKAQTAREAQDSPAGSIVQDANSKHSLPGREREAPAPAARRKMLSFKPAF